MEKIYCACFLLALLQVTWSSESSTCLSNTTCPLGFESDSEGRCVCAVDSDFPFGGSIHCKTLNVSEGCFAYSVVKFGECITYDADNASNVVAGPCFQAYTNFSNPVFWPGNCTATYIIPTDPDMLQDYFCHGSHWCGTLCSECSNDTAIDINSITLDCIPKTHCSNLSWLWLVLELTLPSTLFFVIVVYFQPDINSPNIYIAVILSQLISTPLNIISIKMGIAAGFSGSLTWVVDIVVGIYGVWNLDFFRYLLPSVCVSQPMGRMQVLALDYATAFFPLFLIVLMSAYSRWGRLQHLRPGGKVLAEVHEAAFPVS